MLELIIACISAIGNVLLAVLVLAKNPQKHVNRYFAGFALILGFWALTNYVSLHPIFLDQLSWIRFVMMIVSIMCLFILLLSNTFPTGAPYYKKLPRFVVAPAVIIALLAVSPWLFSGIHYTDGQAQPEPGPAMALFVPYAAITLGLSLTILIRKFKHLRGVAREYIRYALIGIVLTFALLFLTNFIVVLVFKNSSLVAASPVFGLIFTTSFAYGMIRYQLFDIRSIIARFVSYLLLLVFAGAVYGFAAAALSFFAIGVQPSFTQIIFSTIIVGVMILLTQPLRQFFNRITRAIFYQDDYDTKNVLDRLTSILVRATDTKVLAKNSMAILKSALKSDQITLLLLSGDDGQSVRHISTGDKDIVLSADELSKLYGMGTEIVVADMIEGRSDWLRKKMQKENIAVVTRLKTQSGVMGYCFFGYKTSGSAYGRRDIDLMRIAGDELAVAIQNTLRFDQIQEFNDTLKQRIEEATKELRASNTQLQRLDEAKDEFVSMASHQLRTPLTSVKGYISMVLEGDVGKITAMQRQLLGEAFTSSERMVHLINDFLNVSRLQTGKFVLESRPTDLAKIVTQEVDSLKTTAQAHNMELKFRAPSVFPMLTIDEGKIRQVLMNFIDNAIYYSREHTVITIELGIEDGDAVVRVYDTGIGVPKAEQAHLFTKFFRATNARKQRPDGTGVGLFLAKKVIDSHGGSMVFESVEDEGSTFGFRLPIKKLSVAAKSPDKLDK
jgi:signal transduction histidine kinase